MNFLYYTILFVKVFQRTLIDDLNQNYERGIISQEKFFEEQRQKEVSENISVVELDAKLDAKLDVVLNSIEKSRATEGVEQGGPILQKIEELQKQVFNLEKNNMAVSKKLDTIENSNHDYNQKVNQLVSQHHGDVNVHGTYAVSWIRL